MGDIAESKALKEVFGEHLYDMNINSTKSMTGHLLGAAGAIEAIASILAIKHQIVPPQSTTKRQTRTLIPKSILLLEKPKNEKLMWLYPTPLDLEGTTPVLLSRKFPNLGE